MIGGELAHRSLVRRTWSEIATSGTPGNVHDRRKIPSVSSVGRGIGSDQAINDTFPPLRGAFSFFTPFVLSVFRRMPVASRGKFSDLITSFIIQARLFSLLSSRMLYGAGILLRRSPCRWFNLTRKVTAVLRSCLYSPSTSEDVRYRHQPTMSSNS